MADSIINRALEAVIGLMNALEPFAAVTRGALPIGRGITCEISPSGDEAVFLDKRTYTPISLTINGKHESLDVLGDTLNDIHHALTRMMAYPEGEGFEIVDITNETLPQLIGREENNLWLMASSLTVKIYMKGSD